MILDPNTEVAPGQILWSDNNKNRRGRTAHHMLYISDDPDNPDLFIGVMLTSRSQPPFINIEIPEHLFEKTDARGNAFNFPSKPTFFRPRKHLKKIEWQPFNITGQLTKEGLDFVIANLSDKPATYYEFNKEKAIDNGKAFLS